MIAHVGVIARVIARGDFGPPADYAGVGNRRAKTIRRNQLGRRTEVSDARVSKKALKEVPTFSHVRAHVLNGSRSDATLKTANQQSH